MTPVALGFRVKSGYAIAVALRGPASAPEVVARGIVQLSDPDVAETRQPYHDGFYTHEGNARTIARRVKIVERCATRSVTALVRELRLAPPQPEIVPGAREPAGGMRAALVVGSVIDPKQVGNPHIRAHANEGRLFRTVLESALRSHGITCDVIVQKHLAEQAVNDLRRPDRDIKRTLAAFGKALGGPWRADEKAASAAAWLALSSQESGTDGGSGLGVPPAARHDERTNSRLLTPDRREAKAAK